jgi:hypothetical protein
LGRGGSACRDAWFAWDDSNVDHLAEHNIQPDEADDALDPRRLPVDISAGKQRWSAIGMT